MQPKSAAGSCCCAESLFLDSAFSFVLCMHVRCPVGCVACTLIVDESPALSVCCCAPKAPGSVQQASLRRLWLAWGLSYPWMQQSGVSLVCHGALDVMDRLVGAVVHCSCMRLHRLPNANLPPLSGARFRYMCPWQAYVGAGVSVYTMGVFT